MRKLDCIQIQSFTSFSGFTVGYSILHSQETKKIHSEQFTNPQINHLVHFCHSMISVQVYDYIHNLCDQETDSIASWNTTLTESR